MNTGRTHIGQVALFLVALCGCSESPSAPGADSAGTGGEPPVVAAGAGGAAGAFGMSTAGGGAGGAAAAGGAAGSAGASSMSGAGGQAPQTTAGAAGADPSGSAGVAGAPLEPDAGAGPPDAGGMAPLCEPFVEPADCTVPEGAVLPGELRCTGLYETTATGALHCSVREYTPAHTLWSDGLRKRRFVSLPPGEQIDVSDPLEFSYPIGTQFWKEFALVDGDAVRVAETRLLRRVDGGWMYTTYVWDEAGTVAVQQNEGVEGIFGSGHNVPSRQQCKECHSGRTDYVLGWDAFLLGPGAQGITRDTLVEEAWVTWAGQETGSANPLALSLPGDEVEQAALGYLHVNCGVSCHNGNTFALALETGFFTRLEAGAIATVQDTAAYQTGLLRSPSPNAPLSELPAAADGLDYVDLRPLAPESSLLYVRMLYRDEDAAMPRLGTSAIDETGVDVIRAWIEGMTAERGYSPGP